MILDNVKDWLRTKVPITAPGVVDIQIKGVIDDFGNRHVAGQVNLPLIEEPDVTSDFLDWLPDIFPADLSLSLYNVGPLAQLFKEIVEPVHQEIPFLSLENIPEVLDFFTALEFLGQAGKAYEDESDSLGRDTEEAIRLPLVREECRHGLPKYSCDICLQEMRKRRKSRQLPTRIQVKTADVFDLLLPYLQPPLEPLLDQPVLFPPDRRPYPYQVEGIRYLSERTIALLGDDMGLGKTIQTIVALQLLFRRRSISNVLILCPLSVLGTWEKEIKKWAPELFVLKVRGDRETRKWLWNARASIYLTTYDTLRSDADRNLVSGTVFDLVVLDEAQKIKNPETATARAVRGLEPQYRWGLSGTPLENKIEDVIAIFEFLKPGLFDRQQSLYGISTVRNRIAPYILRRRIAEVIDDLPEKKIDEIWLDLTDSQLSSYDAAVQEAREQLSRPDATRIHVFALISELKQICNIDPATRASCKLDYLLDQLEPIVESGYKALVYSQFPEKTLVELKKELGAYEPEIYHGGLTARQRDTIIEDFQEADTPKILLISLKAGGVGVTLTRANHVFHFDHWWNPAVSRQAEARAWRIGQKETVFVHGLYTNNTIEERIHNILQQKQQLFDEVIDDLSAKMAMSSLTDEELFGLFDLEPPEHLRSREKTQLGTVGLSRELMLIKQLTPNEFEDLVAKYYGKRGFVTNVTARTRDKGVDLDARRASDVGVEYLIVQCKHYPDRLVGPSVVRELIGTWQDHREANRAVLVTSGKFSEDAKKLAKKHRIDLVDGIYLSAILRKEGIPVSDR